jgi:hypothetical protein
MVKALARDLLRPLGKDGEVHIGVGEPGARREIRRTEPSALIELGAARGEG